MSTNEQSVLTLIRDFERQKLFGSIEVKIEAGRIVMLRKIETLKPNDCRETRGQEHERS